MGKKKHCLQMPTFGCKWLNFSRKGAQLSRRYKIRLCRMGFPFKIKQVVLV